ncbi:MAG TPA: hypothetical protein VNO34_00720 [Actinomycetota bacterium]|nr:hypothetical protein [Actinomycetota bacterium]
MRSLRVRRARGARWYRAAWAGVRTPCSAMSRRTRFRRARARLGCWKGSKAAGALINPARRADWGTVRRRTGAPK